MKELSKESFIDALNTLSASHFPKRCFSCGSVFNSLDDFLNAAESPAHSTLQNREVDSKKFSVQVYTQCHCGAPLLDTFADHRDESRPEHREAFGQLMTALVDSGLDQAEARQGLLDFLRGDTSAVEKFGREK